VGFAMACSNTFGLVTGAFLLGFGLSEIPRNIWKNADWSHRQKVLSHRVAKMAVKLDNAHQEYSNAIVVCIFHKFLSNSMQFLHVSEVLVNSRLLKLHQIKCQNVTF
jgi:hypothetical protein